MTGKGLFNQTRGTHPFSFSSSLCLPTKFSLSPCSVPSFFSFPIHLVYLFPPLCSFQAPTVTPIAYHSLDPQSLLLTTYLASYSLDLPQFSEARAPFLKRLCCSQHTTPLTLTPALLALASHKGVVVTSPMGWLMNLLLQLGWSPEPSVCGRSSLQGREDTQFWTEYSAPKRKVTH